MKQSWAIGGVALWLVVIFFEMMTTGGTEFSSEVRDSMNSLWTIDLTNFAGAASAAVTLITNVGTYLTAFIQIVFLWSPTLFAGNFYWFWLFVCFPISIGFIVSLITIARGGSAS